MIKLRQKGGPFVPLVPTGSHPPASRAVALGANAVAAKAPPHWTSAHEIEIKNELLEAVAKESFESGTPWIAVVVPVLARPHRVKRLVASFTAATDPADAKLYFVAQASDIAEIRAIRQEGLEPIVVPDTDRSWAKKINHGYQGTTEPWLLLGADDLNFHRGWVATVRGSLRTHPGVIGTNDLGNRMTMVGTHSTHPLVRRTYAKICGTADRRDAVVHDGYHHNFPDTELVATALARGLYVHRSDCIIEHMHPNWKKGAHDAVYALGMSQFHTDNALFLRRGRTFGW